MSRAFTKERDDAPDPPLVLAKREEPEYRRPADRSTVGFGATVRVYDGAGFDRTFTIVKDSNADVAAGKIGMSSPLAQALLNARTGDRVLWHRPIGEMELTITELRY
ncbi:MAG: GreA/GreB family elongation factor [Candidatus Baltobacteraceae bacterium]